MSALELKVYDILKLKFSEQEASVVIEYVEETVKKGIEEKVLLTQKVQSKDIELLKSEIREDSAKTKGETNEGFAKAEVTVAKLRADMNEGFAQIRGDMKTAFSEVKVEILRWMFGIFTALMLAILGLYLRK
jgi:hypothetical protein